MSHDNCILISIFSSRNVIFLGHFFLKKVPFKGIERKNKLSLLHMLWKLNVVFNYLKTLKKIEILLSDFTAILFDFQRDFCSVYVHTDASFLFLLLQKTIISFATIFLFLVLFFFRKKLVLSTCIFLKHFFVFEIKLNYHFNKKNQFFNTILIQD